MLDETIAKKMLECAWELTMVFSVADRVTHAHVQHVGLKLEDTTTNLQQATNS